MTLAFNNLPPVLEKTQQELIQKAPNESGITCWMDDKHKVTVAMKRVLTNSGVPKEAQHSANKTVKDTATVTIDPPNKELNDIVSKYFLSKKIPSSMGAPDRFFFDSVTINENAII